MASQTSVIKSLADEESTKKAPPREKRQEIGRKKGRKPNRLQLATGSGNAALPLALSVCGEKEKARAKEKQRST
jgi:hypothetical protein